MARNKAYLRRELVKVAESEVHGKGLFAAKKIPEGTELGICKVRKAKAEGPYVLWLDDKMGSVEVTCDLRYINHSPDANVSYYDDLSVVALRDIRKGEELLHHYGDEWE